MILIWESPKGQKLNCTDNHLWPSLQACLRYRYHLHTRFLPSSFMYPGVGIRYHILEEAFVVATSLRL